MESVECVSNVEKTIKIEWLNMDRVVLIESTAAQQLHLEFNPINDSIDQHVYICRVTENGTDEIFIDLEQKFTMNVTSKGTLIAHCNRNYCLLFTVPPNVTTTNISRSGTSRAGEMYALSCSVSKTVDGLLNSPNATWMAERMAIFDEAGVAVSSSSDGFLSTSILTFTSLRTSHGGKYCCNSQLSSPTLETPLKVCTMEEVYVQSKTRQGIN